MITVVEHLRSFAEELNAHLTALVRTYSEVYLSNPPGSGLLIVAGNHSWRPLPPEGQRLQARVLEEYRRFCSIMSSLLREQPAETLRLFKEAEGTVLRVIQQDDHLWDADKLAPLAEALPAMDSQVGLLQRLYAATEGAVYVPDTNALLYNPDLETWRFEAPLFALALVPSVVAELDRLKVEHRNRSVRQRAERLVRQVKEYRRRGSLIEGVPIVASVSTIFAVAVEPDFERSLPWLDRHNQDDRILASMLEVMRTHPRSAVTLVTRDLNLQNKATFAGIPFIEPPDPQRAVQASPNKALAPTAASAKRGRGGSAPSR